MKGYIEGLDRMGLGYEIIEHPEYVGDIRRRDGSSVNLHFGFYPPDQPRFLKGAYNVLVMAWEFERLRRASEQPGDHAFADPAAMIARADEVWTVSNFAAEAVARSGPKQAASVPSPVLSGLADSPRTSAPTPRALYRASSRLDGVDWIPLATGPFLAPRLWAESYGRRAPLRTLIAENIADGPPIFFLSVFNIYDYRKQIKPLLEAFINLAKHRRNVFLLLKINYIDKDVGDTNETLHRYQIADRSEIAPPLISNRILLSNDTLTRDELNRLYDVSAFYVCSSHGEGQNLPLIEAMGRGVVPVSVDHTAMADYIGEDNAVIIPSTLAPFNVRLRERYGMADLDTYYVTARDVYAALEHACGLTDDAYAAASRAARATVGAKFGLDPFRLAIDEVMARARDHAAQLAP